jgi:hypothetical protein
MLSAPTVRWQECRDPKAFPFEGKGGPLAVDEMDTQKSGTLFADELRLRRIRGMERTSFAGVRFCRSENRIFMIKFTLLLHKNVLYCM